MILINNCIEKISAKMNLLVLLFYKIYKTMQSKIAVPLINIIKIWTQIIQPWQSNCFGFSPNYCLFYLYWKLMWCSSLFSWRIVANFANLSKGRITFLYYFYPLNRVAGQSNIGHVGGQKSWDALVRLAGSRFTC